MWNAALTGPETIIADYVITALTIAGLLWILIHMFQSLKRKATMMLAKRRSSVMVVPIAPVCKTKPNTGSSFTGAVPGQQ